MLTLFSLATVDLSQRLRSLALPAVAVLTGLPLQAQASIVSDWNKVALVEVRAAKHGPPVVARALAITHTCIYDAWAAYDENAKSTTFGSRLRRPESQRTSAKASEALSYAAYRCLVNLYPAGESRLRTAMQGFGYNPDNNSTDVSTPAGLGNTVAEAVIDSRRNDGSNQYGDLAPGAYADYTGYAPRNVPMGFCMPHLASCPPLIINDQLHWQPLINDVGVLQKFIAPHWERVKPFALTSATQFDNVPSGPLSPTIQRTNGNFYRNEVNSLLDYIAGLTPERKLIVEYWADGPASELPPGHWGIFAQYVSERDRNSVGDDAKMFFAMHNASFDAGIVAWHLKRKFDGVRPITAVRYLKQGQSVRGWGGPGRPVEWIQGERWTPYNPGSNLTPSFPGYISGHSSFSSASATVLQLFTGSDKFGFSTVIQPNFGRVEPGVPAVPTKMSYAKFSDAAKEAGLSRLYAGIHFEDDNTIGQTIGAAVGKQAYQKARKLFNGEDD